MRILFSQVPEYLHESELYLTFKDNDENGDFEFEIGEDYPPETEEVNNIDDYIRLFSVYDRFCKYPSKAYFNFEDKNKIEIIKFLGVKAYSHINAEIMLERILNPLISLTCSVKKDEHINLNFILINREIKHEFTILIVDREINDFDLNDIIKAINLGDIRTIWTSGTHYFSCDEFILSFGNVEDFKISLSINDNNKKTIISCFNKIIKDIENLGKPHYEELFFTGQIQIDNLDVLYNYFSDTEFVEKLIILISNKDINDYLEFISTEDDTGRIFTPKEFSILMNIKSLMR